MLRPARFKLLASAVAACGCALAASAQSASQPEQPASATATSSASPTAVPTQAADINPAAKPQTPKPESATPPPTRVRAVSPALAAQLRAAADNPKYAPPAPEPPHPVEAMVDARKTDKPQNDIIRLPEYVVLERKPQVFTERDISTQKGLTDIAMKRYISETDYVMNRFHIPIFGQSVEDRALAMYAEQERLNNIDATETMAKAVSFEKPAEGAYLLKESQKTFMRKDDFGWSNGNNTDRK